MNVVNSIVRLGFGVHKNRGIARILLQEPIIKKLHELHDFI